MRSWLPLAAGHFLSASAESRRADDERDSEDKVLQNYLASWWRRSDVSMYVVCEISVYYIYTYMYNMLLYL